MSFRNLQSLCHPVCLNCLDPDKMTFRPSNGFDVFDSAWKCTGCNKLVPTYEETDKFEKEIAAVSAYMKRWENSPVNIMKL